MATGPLNVAPAGFRELTMAALGATRQRLELEAAYAAVIQMLKPEVQTLKPEARDQAFQESSQLMESSAPPTPTAPISPVYAGQSSTRPLSSKASDLTESLPPIDETALVIDA